MTLILSCIYIILLFQVVYFILEIFVWFYYFIDVSQGFTSWNVLKLANILHYNLEFFNGKCKISDDYSEMVHSNFIKF